MDFNGRTGAVINISTLKFRWRPATRRINCSNGQTHHLITGRSIADHCLNQVQMMTTSQPLRSSYALLYASMAQRKSLRDLSMHAIKSTSGTITEPWMQHSQDLQVQATAQVGTSLAVDDAASNNEQIPQFLSRMTTSGHRAPLFSKLVARHGLDLVIEHLKLQRRCPAHQGAYLGMSRNSIKHQILANVLCSKMITFYSVESLPNYSLYK